MNVRNTKPTPGNIRRRLARIEEFAEQAATLASRWNPKGRYFTTQRELLRQLPLIAKSARELRALFAFRAPARSPRRRQRNLGDLSKSEFGKLLNGMLKI